MACARLIAAYLAFTTLCVVDTALITHLDKMPHAQGLKLHLEACHDRFVYGFSEEHPDVAPAIHIACKDESQVAQEATADGSVRSTIVQASCMLLQQSLTRHQSRSQASAALLAAI